MSELAVFIAADHRVVRSSIVAFESFRRFHPDIPRFYCSSLEKIKPADLQLLQDHDITHLDLEVEYEFKSSKGWPREVFWNYKAPAVLGNLGFKYSIKFDNDLLVQKKIDFDKILPSQQIYSGIDHGASVAEYICKDPVFFTEEFGFTKAELEFPYTNTGFLVFNNGLYVEHDVWGKMVDFFDRILRKKTADIFFADQALFAFVTAKLGSSMWKPIHSSYNYLIHYPANHNDFARAKSSTTLHFTGPKPWRGLTLRWFRKHPKIFWFRRLWQDYTTHSTVFNWDLSLKKDNNYAYLRLQLERLFLYSPLFWGWYLIWFLKHKKRGNI